MPKSPPRPSLQNIAIKAAQLILLGFGHSIIAEKWGIITPRDLIPRGLTSRNNEPTFDVGSGGAKMATSAGGDRNRADTGGRASRPAGMGTQIIYNIVG